MYLPLTVLLQLLPYTGHPEERARRRSVVKAGPTEIVRVLREVVESPTITAMVILTGLSAILVGNAFQSQMPEFAAHHGAGGAGFAYAALQTAHAGGALVGGLLLEGRGLLQPRARTAIVCASLWCASIIGFAAAPNYPVALGMLLLAGGLRLASGSMSSTLVQLLAPSHMRGRVLGVLNASQSGLQVGAGFTVGVMGAFIGVHWSLGLSAGVLLVATLGLLAFLERRTQGEARNVETVMR